MSIIPVNVQALTVKERSWSQTLTTPRRTKRKIKTLIGIEVKQNRFDAEHPNPNFFLVNNQQYYNIFKSYISLKCNTMSLRALVAKLKYFIHDHKYIRSFVKKVLTVLT